jgi:type IV pilus assembly protein PilB
MSDSGQFAIPGKGSRTFLLPPEPTLPLAPPDTRAVRFHYLGQLQSAAVLEQQPTRLLVAWLADALLLPGQEFALELLAEATTVSGRGRVAWARWEEPELRVAFDLLPATATAQRLNLERVRIDPSLALQVPPALALRRQVLPFGQRAGVVQVACLDPNDHPALQAVERLLKVPVMAVAAEPDTLKRCLARVYGTTEGATLRTRSVDLRNVTELEPDSAVTLGQELLHAAVLRQASDIHIDPDRANVHIRFRVDGVLEPYRSLPLSAHAPLVSRLKVLCGMDIAERRAPQDGAYQYADAGVTIDIRAAALPTKHGERMTLRLLAHATELLTLERLGLGPRDLVRFEYAIAKPHGLILLTGPTGSGKSTTLAAALRHLLSRESLNVVTVEDPIEYDIPGAAQVQVDAADKVNFGRALRSILRHDPDVVMIGEIRDQDSASIALQAALTGHLVFSTLHTNTAAGVVTRLADMGVERYLIGAALRLSVAQRLVRRLCPHCAQADTLSARTAGRIGRPDWAGHALLRASGCLYCGERGYHGRLGLFELLSVDEPLGRQIAEGAHETALVASGAGAPTLLDDALAKLAAGLTTIDEVLAAVTLW